MGFSAHKPRSVNIAHQLDKRYTMSNSQVVLRSACGYQSAATDPVLRR